MMEEKGIHLHLGTNIVDMAPATADHEASRIGTSSDAAMGAPADVKTAVSGRRWRNGRACLGQGLQRAGGVFDAVLSPPDGAPIPTGWG
jgi:hypothetical protein